MTELEQQLLDRLIEEGLALYGEGDLDGALVLWERVLAEDPGNAQATSYVDYVRTNYDTLTAEGQDAIAEAGPFALGAHADPGYAVEVTSEDKPASKLLADVDAGWDDEGSENDTLDLAAASPEALQGDTLSVRGETFDDATREYDPRTRAAQPEPEPQHAFGDLTLDDGGSFAEKTGIRKRDLGFVQPAPPVARAASQPDSDFEPPTREHRAVGARNIMDFELDAPDEPLAGKGVSAAVNPSAPTRDLPVTFSAMVSAPTRELGLRQLALQPTELHETSQPGNTTRADIVLPFDPIDARTAEILDAVDEGAPASESKDERTRRRISTLMERAAQWSASGDLDRAVAAVDLALEEDPNSAIAQKLIARHRETTQQVFQAFLGDLSRQPMLSRPLHELGNAPISPRAAFLLSRVDGNMTVDEILDVSGMPRTEAYRYLCQLFLRGILR